MSAYNKKEDWSILKLPNDPTPGDSEEIAQLAAHYGSYASELVTACDAMRYTKHTALTLQGSFSLEFSVTRDGIYDDVRKLHDSAERVKDELKNWSNAVEDAQSRIAQVLENAKRAQSEITQQSRIINNKHDEMKQNSDKGNNETYQATLRRANAAKVQAQNELSDYIKYATNIVNDYNDADSTCNAALQGFWQLAAEKFVSAGAGTKFFRKIGKDGLKLRKGWKVYKELKGKKFTVRDQLGKKGKIRHNVYLDGKKVYEKKSGERTRYSEKYGERFKKNTEVDFDTVHFGRKANGHIDFSEVGKSGKQSFKSGMDFTSDFRGFKGASSWAKTGKILGAAGTVLTFVSNAKTDLIDDNKSSAAEKTKNYVVDTSVDLASGAAAGATGAMIGTMIGGPAGTLIGYGAGIAINWAINNQWDGSHSVSGLIKSGLKGLFHF